MTFKYIYHNKFAYSATIYFLEETERLILYETQKINIYVHNQLHHENDMSKTIFKKNQTATIKSNEIRIRRIKL